MKIALINDTHFGARQDSSAFHNYFMKFYNNVFFPYLEEHQIKTVVHLGDVVERRKFINFNILRKLRAGFVFRLGLMNVDTHIIIGNHDTYWKNTNSVNSMEELFTTFDGSHEPWIYSQPKVVNFDGLDVLMMPWINSDNQEACVNMLRTTKASVVMGHLEVKGFEMYRGHHSDVGQEMSNFQRFDMVMSGHFHHKSDNGTVYYLGAPYEITWSDFQDSRGFHVFDTDSRELTRVENPYRMFHKVYYDDKGKSANEVFPTSYTEFQDTCVKVVVLNKTQPKLFDELLDKLYKQNPIDLSIVEDFTEYDSEVSDEVLQAEDTLTILGKYVDNMELDIKKPKLKGLLNTLYTEAINAES